MKIFKLKNSTKRKITQFFIGKKKLRLKRTLDIAMDVFYNGEYDYDPYLGFGGRTIPISSSGIKIKDFGITNILIKDKKEEMYIYITLQYPGIFIGQYGRNMDELRSYLRSYFGKNVKFKIEESNIFAIKPWIKL